jgi:SAM-dependent methyltransferase
MNLELFLDPPVAKPCRARSDLPLAEQLRTFSEFGKVTACEVTRAATAAGGELSVPSFRNEFWTAKQRAAHSLHEISYRACFKPQLPRFFIERLTEPGEVVYDPFTGRGTTLLEAALLGRVPFGCDINPLSRYLIRPRLNPPHAEEVALRLQSIDFQAPAALPEELLVFYHAETLQEICALRGYLLARREAGTLDAIDEWIWMVALNRLTGHSAGFFSVYTLPPNQAVSVKSQHRINATRNQVPPRRDVPKLILRKTRQLLKDCGSADLTNLRVGQGREVFVTGEAAATPAIPSGTVALVVTSPPFLDVVDYATDNWLRCWFVRVDAKSVKLTVPRRLEDWQSAMADVFRELARVLRPGGHVAFEVGEVRRGEVRLEEAVLPCGADAGLEPLLVMINDQQFTKTANCWGVDNNAKGTNTNRIVVFRKKS